MSGMSPNRAYVILNMGMFISACQARDSITASQELGHSTQPPSSRLAKWPLYLSFVTGCTGSTGSPRRLSTNDIHQLQELMSTPPRPTALSAEGPCPSACGWPACLTVSGVQHASPPLPQSRQYPPVFRQCSRAARVPAPHAHTRSLTINARLAACLEVPEWSRDTWPMLPRSWLGCGTWSRLCQTLWEYHGLVDTSPVYLVLSEVLCLSKVGFLELRPAKVGFLEPCLRAILSGGDL